MFRWQFGSAAGVPLFVVRYGLLIAGDNFRRTAASNSNSSSSNNSSSSSSSNSSAEQQATATAATSTIRTTQNWTLHCGWWSRSSSGFGPFWFGVRHSLGNHREQKARKITKRTRLEQPEKHAEKCI